MSSDLIEHAVYHASKRVDHVEHSASDHLPSGAFVTRHASWYLGHSIPGRLLLVPLDMFGLPSQNISATLPAQPRVSRASSLPESPLVFQKVLLSPIRCGTLPTQRYQPNLPATTIPSPDND